MGAHVVLLGDSVFDNASYVDRGESVSDELSRLLPEGARLSMPARDGAVIPDVYEQLPEIPRDATELVLSVGGNDAVSHWSLLNEDAGKVRDGLREMGAVVDAFRKEYATLLDAILIRGVRLTVCTIYEGDFAEFGEQAAVNAAVALFDSAIYRSAAGRSVDVIELRDICNTSQHFTQTIEPSAVGSRAIASGIARRLDRRLQAG